MIYLFIKHKKLLKQETKQYAPIGDIKTINQYMSHQLILGNKEKVCVLLAGHGTILPTIDYKVLAEKLSHHFKVIIIEKPGYGYSSSPKPMSSIDEIIEFYRLSIKEEVGVNPFILVAHSMAGLEAIYWAQKYPNEVKTIVGIDACVPYSYEVLPKPNHMVIGVSRLFMRIGLARLLPFEDLVKLYPILNSDDLSDEEKNRYIANFYRTLYSKQMITEIKILNQSIKKILSQSVPSTRYLMFIASEQNQKYNGWKEKIDQYLEGIKDQKVYVLKGSHYLHYEQSAFIAKAIIDKEA